MKKAEKKVEIDSNDALPPQEPMNDLSDRIASLSPAKRQLLELRLKDELLASSRKTEDAKGLTLSPIGRIPRQARHPASFSQARLWFIERLSPSPAYNSGHAIRLTGPLNPAALEQGINEIVRRQDALRTIFSPVDGEPFQVITPPSSVKLPMVDLRVITDTAEREVEAERLVTEETERLFDLEKGPLFRSQLVCLSDEDHILILVMHHIISDGWSWGVFFRELERFYAGFSTGSPSPDTELPVQYVDFAHWQHDRLQGDLLEQQLSYWKKRLSGAPELLDLPTDRPRPAVQTFRGGSQSVMLSKSFTEQLRNLSRAEGATLFMTLLAAFQALLCRLTRQEDIVVGSPIAGRNRSEIEGLIGFFINTIVLRTDLSGNPSFRELLGRVREVALGAYAHPDVPFERLMEELKVERSLSRSALFQVMFTFQNFPRQAVKLPGLTVRPVKVQRDTAKFDLTLYAVEGEEGLTASIRYNTDLFDEGTIKRMLGHFKTLLEGVVANPEWRLSELPLLTAVQRHQLLVEWNNTSRDYPKENCIHRLFEEQAKRTPDAAAVVFEEKQLTYRELNDAANRLAFLLSEKGIGKGSYVPILMERSMEVAISMLSIMKVGAAFVPLDVRWPTERIKQALEDLPTGVVLVNKKTPFDEGELGRAFFVLDDLASGGSTSNPNIRVEPWQPIYAIYTSGSTGRPKAAVVPHRGITNRFLWMNEFFGCETAAAVLQTTPHFYDSAVWQLFWPLINGGKTVIPSPGMEIAADYLSRLIARFAVTMTDFVPSVFNTIVPQLVVGDSMRRKLSSLRCIIVGGEEIRPATTYNFMEYFPHVRVVNLYGPTEASIGCIYYEVSGKDGDRIPIGRPISNVQVLILDRNMNPAPVGVAGELYLSGICLGLGYLNDEQKTNAAFINNRFAEISYSKLYNTGDLARYLPDGNIEFLGRLDNQVKIRGFRIELGEIDAVLGRHPAIQQVVTLAREDEPGNKRLVAYVVPNQERVPTASELRSFLKAKLPDYMVPSAFIMLDSLPLTPNGKVDRRVLPSLNQAKPEPGECSLAPRDEMELRLTKIWENVLGVHGIGVRDNFFELGGHSLLAVRVLAHIEKTFGKSLPLATVFQAPTVEQLAGILRQEGSSTPWSSLVALQPHGSKPPFFWVHGENSNPFLPRYLGPDQPLYGLLHQSQDGKRASYTSIEDIAAHYLKEIRSVQPDGPFFLGGFCIGGTLAFEMARQLQRQDQKVALLVLLDATSPGWFCVSPDSPKPLRNTTPFREEVYRHVRNLTLLGAQEKLNYVLKQVKRGIQGMAEKVSEIAKRGAYKVCLGIGYPLPPTLQYLYRADLYRKAAQKYVSQAYPGRVIVFKTKGRSRDPRSVWGRLAGGGLEVIEVPGKHADIVFKETQIEGLAKQLKECLDQAQASAAAAHGEQGA